MQRKRITCVKKAKITCVDALWILKSIQTVKLFTFLSRIYVILVYKFDAHLMKSGRESLDGKKNVRKWHIAWHIFFHLWRLINMHVPYDLTIVCWWLYVCWWLISRFKISTKIFKNYFRIELNYQNNLKETKIPEE